MSLSGDFQGTDEGPLIVETQRLLFRGTPASVIQQTNTFGKPSQFLQALNKHGNKALVPTTSTYGREDQIIQIVSKATSLGAGGAPFTHVAVQELCHWKLVDHFFIVINRVAFYLALDAFEHSSSADINRVTRTYPDLCKGQSAPNITNHATLHVLQEMFTEGLASGLVGYGTPGGAFSMRVKKEPDLLPYAANQP